MELQFNEYNFVYPYNLENARKHYLANRIFKISTLEDVERCQCCDRLIGIQGVLPFYCYNSSELLFLGPGIPLYFLSVRQSFYLLLAELILFGIYSTFTNYFGSSCVGREGCSTTFMNTLSIINNLDNTTQMLISTYLVVGCILTLFVVLQLIRRESSRLKAKSDHYIDLPSNFSIIIRRLPPEYNQWDIEEMINNRRQELTHREREATNNLKIQKIIISYSLRQVIETQERNIASFKQSVGKESKFQPEDNPQPTKVAPLAIVTFEMECSKDYFITKPKTWQKILTFFWSIYLPYSKYEVKGQRVSIQIAPEPDDIYWQNCGISYYGNVCRRLVGKFFILLLLLAGLIAQTLLKYYEMKFTHTPYVQYINIVFSLAVTLFNALLGELLEFVTKKERLETVTEESISLTATLSVLQFINSGVIVMFSTLVINFAEYSMDNLADSVVTIMLINMILPHLIILFWDGFNPLKRLQRWRIKSTKAVFIQQQINEAYEGADYKIAIRCAYVIKTIWLSMFYGLFFPIVIPISMISILGFYHVQKYMYMRHYKVPNMISGELIREVLDLLDYSPFLLGVSILFLYFYLKYFNIKNASEISTIGLIFIYVGVGLSVIHILIPTDKINQRIFSPKKGMCEGYKPTYKEVEGNFNTDYDIANPVYHQINKKKKNTKYFKAIGDLGGLFNFLTVKKETSSANGESRLIFNAAEVERASHLEKDPFAMMIELSEIRKPLADNQVNIFQNYMSNREKDLENKPCQADIKNRKQFMQPSKINCGVEQRQFTVNVSEAFPDLHPCPVKDNQQLIYPKCRVNGPPPTSILKNKHRNKPPQYQQRMLHPHFVSKINIQDIIPIFMGQNSARSDDVGEKEGRDKGGKKGGSDHDTF